VDIRIDRLRLQVPGMHPDAARQFGRLLAEHLAAALAAAPPAPDGSGAAQLTRLRVSVPLPAGQHPGNGSPGSVSPVTAAPAAATQISRSLRGAAAGRTQVMR
jgi:hypothetical protein